MARLFAAAVVIVALPVLASEPGQPLDCSDWVFQPPGYSCSVLPLPPSGNCGGVCVFGGAVSIATDNAGALIFIQREYGTAGPSCGSGLLRTALVRYDGQTTHVLGYIDERCSNSALSMSDKLSTDAVRPPDSPGLVRFVFDDKNGRVLIPFQTFCYEFSNGPNQGFCYDNPGYGSTTGYFVISGLTPAFDIFQSYAPPSGPLSFRVPAMPEGMAAADHFDTYWGNLANPIDFTQAHPLQCNYPTSPPHVGDYLTVADPLPNPSVGQGRYYITAVTHQGQTRYGRKASGGRLSGRDPAVLAECVQPGRE